MKFKKLTALVIAATMVLALTLNSQALIVHLTDSDNPHIYTITKPIYGNCKISLTCDLNVTSYTASVYGVYKWNYRNTANPDILHLTNALKFSVRLTASATSGNDPLPNSVFVNTVFYGDDLTQTTPSATVSTDDFTTYASGKNSIKIIELATGEYLVNTYEIHSVS